MNEHLQNILRLGEKVLEGGTLKEEEALQLAAVPYEDLPFLLAMADRIRQEFVGAEVDLCAIINGRSGKCSEDCRFCAQSAHYGAQVKVYPLLEKQELVAAALQAKEAGARRFSIVTSGRGTEKDKEFSLILEALQAIKEKTGLKVCASLGTLTQEHALQLKQAGVSRYHHNLETGRSFYPRICSTHTYEDRVVTIQHAMAAGLEVCAGGIIGLGESFAQRIELALTLRRLGVHSVPVNILNPIPGTPLAGQPPLAPQEILKTLAVFRFLLPERGIRTAGGREVNLRDLQGTALLGGVSGMLIGGYLTTGGREPQADLRMIADLNRVVAP
ncbi:biotin synthase BioB [Azotosporobacter soli]|uniref:biotin synthase BioB n=1 Tax=Azotosporobacter soli TaxID=3055040 RepID=UPI0031FE999B